ncbi:head to tail connecting protein [Caudoviricetes sp.]|nr:head to tail connecting protein [Caudoviricetes sp.]
MDQKSEKPKYFVDDLEESEAKEFSLARDYTELREDLEVRLSDLKQERDYWIGVWSKLSQYISPQTGKYINSPQALTRGNQSRDKILSNVTSSALRTLASGMLGGMSSPTKPWFQLSLPLGDKDDSKIKIWLSECEEVMRAVMHKSNYYASLATAYYDLGLYGTSAVIIYEDERNGIKCQNLPIGSYCLASDDDGNVTTLMREFNMTLYQMVKRYGVENLSRTAQDAWKARRGLEVEYTLIQAIFPNKDYDVDGIGTKGLEYLDVTFERGSEKGKLLEFKGFKEKPFFASRWFTVNGDVYGESPAMEALPDVERLQYYTKKEMQATEKVLSPPLIASSSLIDQPTHLTPNGLTYVPNITEHGMRALYEINPTAISIVNGIINEIVKRINDAFYKDLWMLLDSLEGVQPRSQMELTKREGEKILQLSPVIQKVQSELLESSIDRIFSILFRQGALPPPPEALQEIKDLKIEYTSELSVAQNVKDTVPIEQFASFIGNLAGVFPDVRDKFAVDETVDDYGRALGLNPKVIRATDKANAIREQRNQQMQQQQMMQQGLAMAQGAKTLSETQVGGGANALALAMGGGM